MLFVSIFFLNNLKVLRILGNTILINTFVSLLKICFFGWDQITSCIYIRSIKKKSSNFKKWFRGNFLVMSPVFGWYINSIRNTTPLECTTSLKCSLNDRRLNKNVIISAKLTRNDVTVSWRGVQANTDIKFVHLYLL